MLIIPVDASEGLCQNQVPATHRRHCAWPTWGPVRAGQASNGASTANSEHWNTICVKRHLRFLQRCCWRAVTPCRWVFTDVSKNRSAFTYEGQVPLSSRSQADMQLSTSRSIKCGIY